MEETPSPMMTDELRKTMGDMALKVAKAVNYINAGTVEFLVDQEGKPYFLEMNTRLQVEHLITEMVTGIDIVKEQIRIAAGEKLRYKQEDVVMRGHAVDCRINCENPYQNFIGCPGTVTKYHEPGGPGIRVDSYLYEGYEIPSYYDSLVAKLAVWGSNRDEAINRMKRALQEYEIEGVETTIPFHECMLEDEHFQRGELHTGLVQSIIPKLEEDKKRRIELEEVAAIAAALADYVRSESIQAVIPRRSKNGYNPWTRRYSSR